MATNSQILEAIEQLGNQLNDSYKELSNNLTELNYKYTKLNNIYEKFINNTDHVFENVAKPNISQD